MVIRELIKFIKWNFANYQQISFLWIFSLVLIFLGIFTINVILYLGAVVFFAMAVNFNVFKYWKTYKEERNNLFTTIKNSS